ncbi:related to BYE1 - negative regulator of transcription elongation [Melanopsichium pennsylvanicum]|uniref:Transcription factor BYE1 n=2 Tax=Melanopsichium pennsylvanicum TaxID=63383 RepID=A0AAJ5C2V2_9BASI|nr:phd finger domain-containing protein [Melanopsichium pennsylvanicum 4]SNX81945.1 related to BYE1 - negative regulator of transcription elongation [Melanopsichium pennsylvanicum]
MSASTPEVTLAASKIQAESSSDVAKGDADVEAAPAGLRRGVRARKPTSKAAGFDSSETTAVAAQQTSLRRSGKRKAEDLHAEQAHMDSERETVADQIDEEVNEVFEGEGGDEEEEDDKQYCICRGKDDGTFMISCEQCQEWYHTKCIGITQKAAKKLDEYICDSCRTRHSETKPITAASKPTKRYKSSKGRQAPRTTKNKLEEPASEPEGEAEGDEEEDASDSDEYVGEGADEVSEAEDAVMEDVSARASVPAPRSLSTLKEKSESFKLSSADKNAARRTSESLRRPSGSSRSAAGPKKGSPRKPAGPSDASTEEARFRARKVLATALEKIFSVSSAKQIQKVEEEAQTDQHGAEAYTASLEEELFESNADAHGSIRVVGTKYKDRFRTFLFSLKDAKNTTLHSRIASGELKATDLAKMSNEELANDSIRQATEKARLEALQRSTLRAEEAGPMRKMTHKGEVEIESDTLHAREQLDNFHKATDAMSEAGRAPATRVSESEPAVTTIAGDGQAIRSADELSARNDESRRSAPAPATQDSPTRVHFGDVWTNSDESKPRDGDAEPQESFGFDVGSPHDEVYDGNTFADTDNAAISGADDFLDSFLDGPAEVAVEQPSQAAQGQSKKQVQRSTTPIAEPPSRAVHRHRHIIWNGLIDLPDIFAFQGHVKQVAGRSLTSAPRIRTKFFPERPMLIAGRLPSKAAIDYLLQVAHAPRTEILAFSMEPGTSKGGIAVPSESDQASFDGMLKHLISANRWGALHVSSSVKGSLIKDFYVVPLYKDEEVPLWLDMAESDCLGADWHTKRDRDLLVLVAVVIRDALQAELSRSERSPGGECSATNDDERQQPSHDIQGGSASALSEAYDPTAVVNIPLAGSNPALPGRVAGATVTLPVAPSGTFGSDALQSLLRTLGRTTAPAASSTIPAAVCGGPSAVVPPPGPPPPGPPPGPPPLSHMPPPASRSPMAGSWSPVPPSGGEEAPSAQQWNLQQTYAAQPYGVAGRSDAAYYGYDGGWGQPAGYAGIAPQPIIKPPQVQEMPEEEYPGQYNPDYLAQASAVGARGGGYGGRGRGQGYGHGHSRARGGRARGREW